METQQRNALSLSVDQRHRGQWVKRWFDIILSLLLLPVVLVVMGLIALLIILDSPGPVLYIGERLGEAGRKFKCFKFRTMHVHGDKILEAHFLGNPSSRQEWEVYRKLRGHDPRVTRMGRYLRKLSLDELPQVINVLIGDMSLVGPRPYLVDEAPLMERYRTNILRLRPGITGLWQVSGRNEIAFSDRLKMESWYVDNWSLWMDAKILVRTVAVVISRRGAT